MRITIAQVDCFCPLFSLDSALDTDDFGFVEEFHAEKMFGIYFLHGLVFLGNLIPGNFIVSIAIAGYMELSFGIFVDALEN